MYILRGPIIVYLCDTTPFRYYPWYVSIRRTTIAVDKGGARNAATLELVYVRWKFRKLYPFFVIKYSQSFGQRVAIKTAPVGHGL
jgi:hypothetical protein